MRLCLESVLVTPDAMDTQQPVVRSPRVDGLDQTERPRLDHLVSVRLPAAKIGGHLLGA